jgi:hypothetical protein
VESLSLWAKALLFLAAAATVWIAGILFSNQPMGRAQCDVYSSSDAAGNSSPSGHMVSDGNHYRRSDRSCVIATRAGTARDDSARADQARGEGNAMKLLERPSLTDVTGGDGGPAAAADLGYARYDHGYGAVPLYADGRTAGAHSSSAGLPMSTPRGCARGGASTRRT